MKKQIMVALSGFFALIVFMSAIFFIIVERYENKITPNVWIGPVDVGGLHIDVARKILQTKVDQIITDGMPVVVDGVSKPLALSTLISSDLTEEVSFDINHAIEQAQAVPILRIDPWRKKIITLNVSISKENLQKNISALFPDAEDPMQDARFLIVPTPVDNGWAVVVIEDRAGREFKWNQFFKTLEDQLKNLNRSQITIELENKTPTVTKAMAENQTEQALAVISRDPIWISYFDSRGKNDILEISKWKLATMLVPTKTGEIGIDKAQFDIFLDDFAKTFERPLQDARLVIENGRVVEFTESKSGVRIDRDAMFELVSKAISEPNGQSLTLAVIIDDPKVKIGDINNLGIKEVLGFGTSSYKGSPINRKKNIQNGVRLLNGILIAPEETFSLLNALKPFDQENGYLPELVIKGDKITPELGGGLCQIGTTTFRAVMNSGLPIIERQNHSLVVSYYNDPANGNPGTDATIYEPAPDFKFLNDTGNYILFQAENLTETQELQFTFWGTLDGRKGSYSPPIVSRWIPVPEAQQIETTDLKPNEEKCQEAHIGADASFIYTIARPDGTLEETIFTSHYRPLPKICLIGKEESLTQ